MVFWVQKVYKTFRACTKKNVTLVVNRCAIAIVQWVQQLKIIVL